MTYGSVCSGIEAATVAWKPLGWRAAWFAEIDSFASAVLAHHYPEVPNFGDFTKIMPEQAGEVDVLVGGTPCQAFSIAGQRAGLDDPRGNLTVEYLRLAARLRPRWLVWENVPGVLSIDGGRTFGSIVGPLAELGYGISYRVLDAQFFGVPQRRRRVFVVGHLGSWQAAAAVLFERESLRRDLAPRRKAAPRVARAVEVGPSGGRFTDVAPTLDARCKDGPIRNQIGLLAFGGNNTSGPIDIATACNAHGGGGRIDFETETFCVEIAPPLTTGANSTGGERCPGMSADSGESLIAHTLLGKANCSHDPTLETYVAHTLRGESMDASEDGTGRGTPIVPVCGTLNSNGKAAGSATSQDAENGLLVPIVGTDPSETFIPIAFSSKDHGGDAIQEVAPTLRAMGHGESHPNAGGQIAVVAPAVIFESRYARNGRGGPGVVCPPLKAQSGTTGKGDGAPLVATWVAVRRLTPRECERLQGFPDDYTLVPTYRRPLRADEIEDIATYLGIPVTQARELGSTPDGPRYKAIGNSMAVPVMRWIGSRIDYVDAVLRGAA
jgi:DNA (cytosine-5)-methyltransferase 1